MLMVGDDDRLRSDGGGAVYCVVKFVPRVRRFRWQRSRRRCRKPRRSGLQQKLVSCMTIREAAVALVCCSRARSAMATAAMATAEALPTAAFGIFAVFRVISSPFAIESATFQLERTLSSKQNGRKGLLFIPGEHRIGAFFRNSWLQ